MRVYIANFGRQNYEWPICQDRGTVATMNAVKVQHFWETGDRESYIQDRMANDLTAAGQKPTRSTASRWFNLMTYVAETSGDIWIHRDGGELWWTTSRPEAPEFSTKIEPIERGREVVVCHKPCEPWSNKSKSGVTLRWNELHPKAKDFLSTEATMQSLSESYRDYAIALINGDLLDAWHETELWKSRSERSKNGFEAVKHGGQVEKIAYQRAHELFSVAEAAERMTNTAIKTTNYSNGQIVDKVVKKKDLGFATKVAMQDYIVALIGAQDYRCELTGLPLELDEKHGDPEMFASLDRIDSDGHYAPGNLQVVCRFANRWKGASKDEDFRRVLGILQSAAVA